MHMVWNDFKSGKTIKLSILELSTLAHFCVFSVWQAKFWRKRLEKSACVYHQNQKSQSNELALGCIAKINTQRGGLGLGGQGSVKKWPTLYHHRNLKSPHNEEVCCEDAQRSEQPLGDDAQRPSASLMLSRTARTLRVLAKGLRNSARTEERRMQQ